MAMPVRSLPMAQNWDCHGCSDCCRTYAVAVTPAEETRIRDQGWDTDPALAGVPMFVWDASLKSNRLNHASDGGCVFLGPDNRCKIHAKFGSAAKPMPCRVYPFVMVPTGDHWRVGVRFACPSAAQNLGRPMREQTADAREYAELVEATKHTPHDLPPIPLAPKQAIPWSDLVRFASYFATISANPDLPIEYKLRAIAAIAKTCRNSTFTNISGTRLKEFLDVIGSAALEDLPKTTPRPGWTGRVMFRQLLGIYARKDVGLNHGTMVEKGPFGRLAAGYRFGLGTGTIPRVHGLIPENVRFTQAEEPIGPLPPAAEELLSRFFTVKLESLQFAGRLNFDLPFWVGLDSLLVTFPAILWLARVFRLGGREPLDAITNAVRIVDDNWGFNPLLVSGSRLWGLHQIADRDDLPKLIHHYAK